MKTWDTWTKEVFCFCFNLWSDGVQQLNSEALTNDKGEGTLDEGPGCLTYWGSYANYMLTSMPVS